MTEPRQDQMEQLEEFTTRVSSGEFHVATSEVIASACIDGRCGGTARPNAAGGTNTVAAALDLLNDLDTGYMTSCAVVAKRFIEAKLPVGGHDDAHADGGKSGCGACDRLPDIYAFMFDAAEHRDFPTGADLKSEVDQFGGTVDHLRGEHNEVLAVINTVAGTTLDRDALEVEFGPNYEAFNVDVWAFEQASRVIVGDDQEAVSDMTAAQIRYNLATACVLCGPAMRVIVRR